MNIAQLSSRLKAGKAGAYIKQAASVIAGCNDTTTATDVNGVSYDVPCIATSSLAWNSVTNPIPGGLDPNTYTRGFTFRGEVKCSSARVRCAFGVGFLVGVRNLPIGGGGINYPGDVGLGWVNVVPSVIIDGVAGRGPQPDVSGGLYGAPLLPFATGFFGPSGPDDVWPVPQTILAAAPTNLPFSYEAMSKTTSYRIQGAIADNDGSYFGPLFLWAEWEIIDPRDGEDTEAILAGCSLNCSARPADLQT